MSVSLLNVPNATPTISAATDLALHCEVYFGEVVGLKLESTERLIRVCSFGFVLSVELLRQTTCAVFASSPSFGFGFAFGSWVLD